MPNRYSSKAIDGGNGDIDWYPLDRSNPTPGDPDQLSCHAQEYRRLARQAFDTAEYLRTVCSAEFWKSGAGGEFRIRCENLAAELLRTVPRHVAAADALDTYVPELEHAQDTAFRALLAVNDAEKQLAAAGYQHGPVTVSESPTLPANIVPDPMPQGQPGQAAFADGDAGWHQARRLWEDARNTQDVAAQRAAARILDFAGQDGLSDKQWTAQDDNLRVEVLYAEQTGYIDPSLDTALNNEADSTETLVPQDWYNQHADELRKQIPTDARARAAWWAALPDAERTLYLDVGVAMLQGLPGVPSVAEYYAMRAAEDAGIDYTSWDPTKGFSANKDNVRKSYEWYREMFDAHPEFQWMGLGRLAGVTVYAGMLDLDDHKGDIGVGGDLQFIQEQLLKAQQAIFTDIGGQHEAYLRGGLPAIQGLYDAQNIDQKDRDAWAGIASGDPQHITAANLRFAFREQRVIIPQYMSAIYHNGAIGFEFDAFLSDSAQNPVPGGQPFHDFYSNGLTKTDPRWDWVTKSIYPSYQDMLHNHPDQLNAAINEPLDEAASKYRFDIAKFVANGLFE
ncbi:hypothetical protein ABH935_005951 [Catenulispora sp. GAS73]|uniref:putative T7SS-secreted protein n=1 Tax=Catenulispora sp. GAS73 TaxID=3156269 RepID=UPI003510E9AA